MVMKSCKSILCCKFVFAYTFVFIYLIFVAGCFPELSTTEQLQRFQAAGPITPQVDVNRLLNAKIHTGYYRVIPGDILELRMPAALRVVSPDLPAWFKPTTGHDDVEPYLFRVSDAGIISLPIIGKIPVAGLTLTEIEILVVNAYYPKYVENLPSVICKVKEYQTQNITVLGGVVRPGLYKLSSDEMSLVAALMKAGGIIDEGAALITIRHADHSAEEQFEGTSDIDQMAYQKGSDLGTESVSRPGLSPSKTDKMSVDSIKESIQHLIELLNVSDDPEMVSAKSHKKQVDLEPIVLPVKNMNIPFADVVLLDGDTIRVEKLDPEVFTVLGPVKTPGVFPYPPDVDYNLMQALAFAEGLDIALNPRYVSIYRQDADGRIVTVTFCLDDKTLARASGIMIKPGDVVSVEMTMGVRVRLVLREMLSIRFDYDLSE